MATMRPVIVGISILSGRWMPDLVCFLSSSLRMRTRWPMGSTVSSSDFLGLDAGMGDCRGGGRRGEEKKNRLALMGESLDFML